MMWTYRGRCLAARRLAPGPAGVRVILTVTVTVTARRVTVKSYYRDRDHWHHDRWIWALARHAGSHGSSQTYFKEPGTYIPVVSFSNVPLAVDWPARGGGYMPC